MTDSHACTQSSNSHTNSATDTAKLFVISAPSGAGKTTLVRSLLKNNPSVTFSISYTTRKPRVGEENGDDYFFIQEDEFLQKVEQGEFLEHAEVFDNYYGTSKQQVRRELDNGKHVLLEIDWQGAEQIRQAWPDCVSVFILPPSLPELERRLRARQTDSEKVIRRRLKDSVADISHWSEFDYIIINDDLDEALAELHSVIAGENTENQCNNLSLQASIAKNGFSLEDLAQLNEEE